MALPKSTAPSGITITRNGNKMDVSWKQPGYKSWQKAQWIDIWRNSWTDLSGIGKAVFLSATSCDYHSGIRYGKLAEVNIYLVDT